MRDLSVVTYDNRKAVIKSDGGSYHLDLYKDNILIETVEFTEHTLKIVERQATNWIENEQVVRPTV